MNIRRTLGLLLLSVACANAFTRPSFAYLDPAAMSYITQALITVVIAGGAVITIYWKKIKLFFKKRKDAKMKDNIDFSSEESKKAQPKENPADTNDNIYE